MDKQRQKYKGLLDMIDGGGAGAVGNEFEGGGLLSVIANAIATPYGSRDRMGDAMQEQRPMARPAGGFGNGSANSVARPEIVSNLDPFGGAGPNVAGVAAERGMGLDPFGGAGPNVTGVAAERGMGLDPFGGAGPNVTGMPMPLTKASDIPGGFNFANAAPGQSPVEMFGGQQPAAYESSPEMQAKRFVADLNAQYPNQAQAILTSTMAQGIFDDYIRNGYQLPAL